MMDIIGDYVVYMFFIVVLFVVLGIIADKILPAIEIIIKGKGKGKFGINIKTEKFGDPSCRVHCKSSDRGE